MGLFPQIALAIGGLGWYNLFGFYDVTSKEMCFKCKFDLTCLNQDHVSSWMTRDTI